MYVYVSMCSEIPSVPASVYVCVSVAWVWQHIFRVSFPLCGCDRSWMRGQGVVVQTIVVMSLGGFRSPSMN
jgi:hypothetical protein